jgi:LDH2 family malate/lactate/ureidoglycolate dehydrogenase
MHYKTLGVKMENTILVEADKLRKCVNSLFTKAGIPVGEAEIIADCLVEADLCGVESHGITRIGGYMEYIQSGGYARTATMKLIKDSPSTAFYDACGSIGFVCGVRAMNTAIAKAKQLGVGVVLLRNCNHYGAAAYYTKMAAREKMIGFTCTNGPPAIAPWGSTQRYHGTNPFSIGFPTKGDPIVVDMATSIVARGKIILAARKGASIPQGWALDIHGNPTTNAKEALAGSLFPVGGVKGYALALTVDILSAILSGSLFGPHFSYSTDSADTSKGQDVGEFFLALNIDSFIGIDTFLDNIEQIKSEIKALSRKDGIDKIYMPGEPEFEKRIERYKNGISVSDVVYNDLQRMCGEYGVVFSIKKE